MTKTASDRDIVVVDDSEFDESPEYKHDPDVVDSRTVNYGPGIGVKNNPVSCFFSFNDIVAMARKPKNRRDA